MNESMEYYFNNWTLMSLDTLGKHFDAKEADGQKRVIDFAHHYLGMGHCIVCSVDVEDKKIFFRRDGGSNGYEREACYNEILDYEPKDEADDRMIEITEKYNTALKIFGA